MKFSELNEKIKEVQLGAARITDVTEGTFSLGLKEVENEGKKETIIHLVNAASKKKHSITIAGLAAMRIADSVEAVKSVETTLQARDAAGIKNLQSAIESEGTTVSENSKFTVLKTLKIMEADGTTPVYKDAAYEGHLKAVAARRAARNEKFESDEARRQRYTEIGDALRQSGVKSDCKGKPEWYLTMPVFQVS